MTKKNVNSVVSHSKRNRISTTEDTLQKLRGRTLHLLAQQNESPADLARQTGISKSAISNVSSGKCPSLATVIALSKHFNVSIDYLCGLTDTESPIMEAIKVLESQIVLSDEQTENGARFVLVKISRPISEYLSALKSEVPEDIKKIYIDTRKNELATAIAGSANQEETMKKYIIVEYVGSGNTTQLPADFENALDSYLRL